MKLISFAVPCYNSAAYMGKCIDSLLKGGPDIEVIIVDDGSGKDNTLEIAKDYEKRYPGTVKAVHQENGGHGAAVNTGLENAEGLFFKVVDSDDWLDGEKLPEMMKTLRQLVINGTVVDMFLFNFIYDKAGQDHKKVMQYRSTLPRDQVFGWKDIKRFHVGQYILMHSVIYRTELLREAGLKLPEHTFYVDNIFVYQPLPYVKTMYYMDINLYHYYIGREDQSVNEKIMISRLDQQIKVNKIMLDSWDLSKLKDRKLRSYMFNYLEIITAISSVLAIKSGEEENLEKKKELWNYIREKHPSLWFRLRYGFLGQGVNIPGNVGNMMTIAAYKIAHRIYGFN